MGRRVRAFSFYKNRYYSSIAPCVWIFPAWKICLKKNAKGLEMTACVLIENKLWIPSGSEEELGLRFFFFFSTLSTAKKLLLNSMPPWTREEKWTLSPLSAVNTELKQLFKISDFFCGSLVMEPSDLDRGPMSILLLIVC